MVAAKLKVEKSLPRLRVEKRIPIPKRRGEVDERFPWLDMEPTDSFFVPVNFERPDDDWDALHKRMVARCTAAGRRNDCMFKCWKAEEKDNGKGVRVWRIATPTPE